ncbi:MAG: D-alanyl-D-alanine carboxypeptidase/D-alanyl-D-alanine-endopeptidase [Symploca sp. SIO3C6]|nr:D-alanyl-D-alanine carboxypeptidase/D-alanyl-D-alanine-endopeptidase [Symploca sp. SIO3C6]
MTVSPAETEWIRVGRDFSDPILYIDGQLRAGSRRDVSAVAISDPTAYFAQQFQDVLLHAGITVNEVLLAGPLDEVEEVLFAESSQGQAIATLPSLSMTEWLQWANQDSHNLAAESLLRQLGASSATTDLTENPTESTLSTAIHQLGLSLDRLGITPDSYRVADGSGLSRRNLVTPMAFVEVLQAMAVHPWADDYRESLAIAATTGTLTYRFRDTVVAGKLYGKSGGLTGVASLSGYLYPPHYSPLAFSIILNHSTQPGRVNRQAIDDIVLQLAQLQECL